MDPVALKVAERIVNKEEIRKRIEAIPGWERSNFLQSIWRSVERYPLSEKQLAVLEKIEKDQASRAPVAKPSHADVMLNPRTQYMDHAQWMQIVDLLRKKNPVTVYDPRGLVAPNHKAQEYVHHQLVLDFYGAAENYAERNADEDREEQREWNNIGYAASEAAAHDLEKSKLHVKQEGPLTTLTLTPSYQDIAHRHALRGRDPGY